MNTCNRVPSRFRRMIIVLLLVVCVGTLAGYVCYRQLLGTGPVYAALEELQAHVEKGEPLKGLGYSNHCIFHFFRRVVTDEAICKVPDHSTLPKETSRGYVTAVKDLGGGYWWVRIVP